MSETETAVHHAPAWRDRADFIITANIADAGLPKRWEQLWAREIAGSTFEVCCIPFFVYDLALGDIVETKGGEEREYVVSRVVVPSGHSTFRVWFGDSAIPSAPADVTEFFGAVGAASEWSSPNLLAVDAASEQDAIRIEDYLRRGQASGRFVYEVGRDARRGP